MDSPLQPEVFTLDVYDAPLQIYGYVTRKFGAVSKEGESVCCLLLPSHIYWVTILLYCWDRISPRSGRQYSCLACSFQKLGLYRRPKILLHVRVIIIRFLPRSPESRSWSYACMAVQIGPSSPSHSPSSWYRFSSAWDRRGFLNFRTITFRCSFSTT